MKKNTLSCFLFIGALLLRGYASTSIPVPDQLQNPAPTEKFSNFIHFEMTKINLLPPYAGQDGNEKALIKIQENVSEKMTPLLAEWNAKGGATAPVRTLLIEPTVTDLKFINGTARFWAGPLAGASAVILRVKITEKETGKVIASPVFYARAAAQGGAWSFGGTDNAMLVRIANRLTDYLAANYDSAAGGPTGVPTPGK
jgi:hypothetical protein